LLHVEFFSTRSYGKKSNYKVVYHVTCKFSMLLIYYFNYKSLLISRI